MIEVDPFWGELGFRRNPYDARPLRANKDDAGLFIGREELGTRFRTLIDCAEGCVAVISGQVGVGKTSFFNHQQYLLFSGEAAFGPRLIPAIELTPLEDEGLSPKSLAQSVIKNSIKGILEVCRMYGPKASKQLEGIRDWLGVEKSTSALGFGLTVLGFGGSVSRQVQVPPPSEATLETWKDVLEVIASEVRFTLGYVGFFVALDNAENVDNTSLTKVLMSFRDTLFAVPGVWWVVMGQSGLFSLITANDSRVAQRIQGQGIEVEPLSADELLQVVEKRVKVYRMKEDAKSPISAAIHTRLYQASRGEIRFVLKTSEDLVRDLVTKVRIQASAAAKGKGRQQFSPEFLKRLETLIVDGQLSDEIVSGCLKSLTFEGLRLMQLRKKELETLKQIGEGEARASEFRAYRMSSMQDFSSNYLTKLFRSNLLHRRQAGAAVYYSLRGYAALAHQYQLLGELLTSARR